MKRKKLIPVFLFLVLSIQVLPLKQIAAWLSSNTMTEEIAHNINPVKAKSGSDDIHPPFDLNTYHSSIVSQTGSGLCNHHRDEALFFRHADDILTPPPNGSFFSA